MNQMKKWLSSRSFMWAAVLLACFLSLPALRTPLVADDIWHRAMLRHDRLWVPVDSGPLSLYTFATGSAEEAARVLESGFAPWWMNVGLRISFFRPISSLTLVLDYTLWPSSPVLMHAHSIAWYLVVVLLAAKIYQRIVGPLSPFAAGIATLFYAIDPTHSLPVGWIANRNALVSAAFSLGALLVHDAGATAATETTKRRQPLFALATAALLALGLGAGEGAIAILFYLAGHAVFLDARPHRSRLLALAPSAVVVIGWIVLYRLGHHGVVGSGVYVEPIHSLGPFLVGLATNVPLLLAAEIGAPSPDPYVFLPPAGQAALVIVAVLAIVWASIVFLRMMKNSDEPTRRVAKFFLYASTLSVLPVSTTFPAGRLLFLTGFGFVGLLAIVVCAASPANEKQEDWKRSRVVRAYVKWTWFGHLVLAPFLFVIGLHQMPMLDGFIKRMAVGIPADGSASQKRLVLVNAPDTAFGYYLIITHLEAGRSPPMRMLMMTGNARDVRITRTGEATFVVHCENGFYRSGTELLFRDPRTPMPVGTKVVLSNVTVTITHALSDGHPDEASFEFRPESGTAGAAGDKALEDEFLFRKWVGKELVPFTLPAIGETIEFAGRVPNVF
jgi:hypothetical protein